ncbi:MAG: hypothetical protein ACHQJ6_00870 [Candidatus Berkiellales bacterium]
MNILADQTFSDHNNPFPRILPSQTKWVQPLNKLKAPMPFPNSFASFATQQEFNQLKPYFLEIDIEEAITLMQPESIFEVTVPVLGLFDIQNGGDPHHYVASVLGINGFGSKTVDEPGEHFPRPDFVVVQDIVGNKYEILLNADGTIEIPEEGTGLFSVISTITFIYNHQQIISGGGCKALSGSHKNTLYLLPPDVAADFQFHISVSHLNANHQRRLDAICSIGVQQKTVNFEKQIGQATLCQEVPDLLFVDLGSLKHHPANPSTLHVTLRSSSDVEYSFTHSLRPFPLAEAHGFEKHPTEPNSFTKEIGLSANALRLLVQHLYSPEDFICDLLRGDHFNLSFAKGYNNFLLRPEGIAQFYHLLITGLIQKNLPPQMKIEHFDEKRLARLNFSHWPIDMHDRIVLSSLAAEWENYDFHRLYQLLGQEAEVEDYFYLYASHLQESLPDVIVEIKPAGFITANILSFIEAKNYVSEVLAGPDIDIDAPQPDKLDRRRAPLLHSKGAPYKMRLPREGQAPFAGSKNDLPRPR